MSHLNHLLEALNDSINSDKTKNIIDKLEQFQTECEECKRFLEDIENQLKIMQIDPTDEEVRDFQQTISNAKSHLMKRHKCVPSGYYMGTFMAIGTSLGVVFGLSIFDNIALGIPIGIGVGIAIGSSLDQDAKKKGLVI
ncbi:hypothetical protein [Gracilibacillus oryzae]|nr:hypothetical protein [Gracilibacillus oryzae]